MNFKIIFSLLGSCLGYFLGGVDGFLYALIIFISIDYITGIMLAICEKKISSKIGFKGLFKKVLIFVLIGIGNIIDINLIQRGSAIRTALIFYYISNEGISILENISKIGLPVPVFLRDILLKINQQKNK